MLEHTPLSWPPTPNPAVERTLRMKPRKAAHFYVGRHRRGREMHQGIYDRLIELARALPGRLTTYSDIAPLAGLSMNNDADRDRISTLLGEILLHEVNQGRPLLTAIVVHRGNDNNPGEGFFSIATDIGRFNGSRDPLARLEFWVRQVQEVHSYWAAH